MALKNKDLVEAIRRKREREGLSIRALASIVGVSFSSLARIERGDGTPDNNSQIRLLEWLGEDARKAGLSFENVAYVHFRASKNAASKTIQCLLKAAEYLKNIPREKVPLAGESDAEAGHFEPWSTSIMLSKQEMEDIAAEFRADLGIAADEALDSLKLRIDGVGVFTPADLLEIPQRCVKYLQLEGCDDWSAMSVPLSQDSDRWAILLNDGHNIERRRVTFLEECWHILLGHKLTKIAKISGSYGRTYDSAEEHDAYYLASATLLPKDAMISAVQSEISVAELASKFGVSQNLVEYRIKRLGLWRTHRRLDVKLDNTVT